MADDRTIINNVPPNGGSSGGGGAGWAVAVIVIVAVLLFLLFGLPRIKGKSGTTINVPDQIKIQTTGGY